MPKTPASASPAASSGKASAKWSQERRLEFVDYRLQWEGQLNRSDLMDLFGISVPQASLDLARYMELAPENMRYDRSARVYLAGERFKPVFNTGDPGRYLNDLLGLVSGLGSKDSSFIGWMPPFGGRSHPDPVDCGGNLGLSTPSHTDWTDGHS